MGPALNRVWRRLFSILAACLCGLSVCRALPAAPIVIANRTEAPIRFVWTERRPASNDSPVIASQVDLDDGKSADLLTKNRDTTSRDTAPPAFERETIQPGDIAVLRVALKSHALVRWSDAKAHEIEPFSAYYFGGAKGGPVELQQIGLGNVANPEGVVDVVRNRFEKRSRTPAAGQDADRERRGTIRVALYVDDDEVLKRSAWQKRHRDRLTAAGKIIERSCGVKLELASYGEWETSDELTDFELTLREFERTVRPRDARLAIGFTSQYQIARGRTHLGGTRGPLASHILLREWSNHVSEAERLELLLHELCHFLGAAHSPESISVMRPVLGDRQARLKSFTIAVDPVNALLMNLVADEIKDRGEISFAQLSDSTCARLRVIYQVLAEAMPDDPAAKEYLQVLDRRSVLRRAMSPVGP